MIETATWGAGSSGGLVGALSPHVPEAWNPKKAFQLESLLMAQGFWEGVESTSGLCSGYGRVGRLQVLADAAAVELARVREVDAVSLWQGRAAWRVVGDAMGLGAGVALGQVMAQQLNQGLQGGGAAAAAAAAAAASAAAGIKPDDVMAMLEKLGDLKAKGILTDEEFTAKKAELLKKLV